MTVISGKPPQFSQTNVKEIVRSIYGFEVSVSDLDSERDQNFLLKEKIGNRYVFKVSNLQEDIELIKLQSAAMKHIHAFDNSINVPRPIESLGGEIINFVNGNIVRVHSYLNGKFIKNVKNPSSQLLNDFGEFLGKLDRTLQEFDYPEMKRDWVWDIRNISFLKDYLTYLPNRNDQRIILHFIKSYESNIYPIEKNLRMQYIHNDGNDHNVLLNDNGQITGIIDFGDMAHTFLTCELAVAVSYLILEDEKPQAKIKDAVDGYQSFFPLREEEVNSLIHLICMRACLTVVTANYRKKLFPNNKYISVTESKAWNFLRNIADKNISDFKI